MRRSLILATAILLAAMPAYAGETTFWRLFVADHTEPKVTAIDLDSGATAGTFALGAPASLYVTPSRAAVFAVEGGANQVSAIASGIKLDDHGDHGDIEIGAPRLLDATVAGDKPVHFVEHDGRIAIFFDGEGVARILDESDWLAGKVEPIDVPTAAPHHGVAVPLGSFVLASRPNVEDPKALPVGIDVIGADGKPVGDLQACPDLHGEAASGDTLAIACATGLLLAKEGKDGPEFALLPYDGLPEGKSTTLLGGVGLQYWLGNYGADKVVLIDPSAAVPFRLVDLPSRRVHFAVDPQQVKFAYILTEDGNLHQLNVLSGAIEKTLSVTEPYSMDGEWSLPRPRIAVAGGEIAVTDPLKSVIHIVDAATFAVVRDIPVAGKPYNLVAVGASGKTH